MAKTERKSHSEVNDRQLSILSFVSEGKTDKEIAGILNVSEATVNRHMSLIYRKWDVVSRAHAVAYAYTNGFLPRANLQETQQV